MASKVPSGKSSVILPIGNLAYEFAKLVIFHFLLDFPPRHFGQEGSVHATQVAMHPVNLQHHLNERTHRFAP